jgi:adenylate cyclase
VRAAAAAAFFRDEEQEGERRINRLRNVALAVLYLNELFTYHVLGAVDAGFHRSVSALAAVYAVAALGWWWTVNRRGLRARSFKYAAMLADSVFLACLLWVANGPSSPLVPLYYLLIAVSALRYNRAATFACSAFSAAAFLGLQLHAAAARPELALPPHAAVIQVLCMLLMGLVSGRVVFHLRALVVRFAAARQKQEKTEGALSRYVSRQVADQIMQKDGLPVLEGTRREATVLMSDIRGFTPMAEKMDPVELMTLLNRYFAAMIEVVFRHDGTLDKFIGDEIMVVFGAPLPQADMEERAVRCALEMQLELAAFNAGQRSSGGPELGAGISVHRGHVVAGSVGSEMRMEYTVMGDVVNLTQRMQGRTAAGKVVVSEAVRAKVEGRFAFAKLEPFTVKGRQEPVLAYEVSPLPGAG